LPELPLSPLKVSISHDLVLGVSSHYSTQIIFQDNLKIIKYFSSVDFEKFHLLPAKNIIILQPREEVGGGVVYLTLSDGMKNYNFFMKIESVNYRECIPDDKEGILVCKKRRSFALEKMNGKKYIYVPFSPIYMVDASK
jgi:hypothetical protein